MPEAAQHVVTLLIVLGCLAWLGRGVVVALRGNGGRVGNCCGKGCGSATTKPRIAFLPVESLRR